MSPCLTQPDEVELALKEIETCNISLNQQDTDKNNSAKSTHENWNSGYVSPYRAAYIQTHNFDQ